MRKLLETFHKLSHYSKHSPRFFGGHIYVTHLLPFAFSISNMALYRPKLLSSTENHHNWGLFAEGQCFPMLQLPQSGLQALQVFRP